MKEKTLLNFILASLDKVRYIIFLKSLSKSEVTIKTKITIKIDLGEKEIDSPIVKL